MSVGVIVEKAVYIFLQSVTVMQMVAAVNMQAISQTSSIMPTHTHTLGTLAVEEGIWDSKACSEGA